MSGLHLEEFQARTIPTTMATVAAGLTSATVAGALTPVLGRWVTLRARGGAITLVRGTATVVAGQGFTLASGEMRACYVSASGSADLSLIGSVATTLEILYDTGLLP